MSYIRRVKAVAWLLSCSVLFTVLILLYGVETQARGSEYNEYSLQSDGVEIKVYTYRPVNCSQPSILFVFHGLNRKAVGVRDKAKKIASSHCLMVFAPLFDKERFPNWRYHRAGVVYNGQVQPPSRWTAPIVKDLIDHARKLVNNQNAKVYLFGHSAGAQFLSRLFAYSPIPGISRVVISNPSVYVAPQLQENAPYGFAGVYSGPDAENKLKEYLESPISIYLGQQDTGEKYLVTGEAASRQGKNRLERGRNIFQMAQNLALSKKWNFGWKLVEVRDTGHSSGDMLQAPELVHALGI